MAKTKNTSGKTNAANAPTLRRGPSYAENPPWLSDDPAGPRPNPPVITRPAILPFLELSWENFERLCYRLAHKDGAVEKAWVYGAQGHTQLGIDVLVRLANGTFETWQSKRHQTFGAAQLTTAIKHFLDGAWSEQAKKFTLAVACEATDPKLIDVIEKARSDLGSRGIAFDPLFGRELAERLKTEAEVVDDFFGRSWAERICPPEFVSALADRISRIDVVALRTRLSSLYTAWIGIVDPGLPLAGQMGAESPAPELTKRYVVPEIILPLGTATADERIVTDEQPNTAKENADGPPSAATQRQKGPPKAAPLRPTERRTSINQFLSENTRAVVSAEAGAGKTTFLRYLALQLLAGKSDVDAINERFVGYVPVWVPFALWARMAEGKDRPPPLEDVVYGFIDALNEPGIAVDMKRALRTATIVLLVDGLDETRDQAIADALLVSLSVFAERKGVPVFATSRPHGTRALSGIGGTWARARLAPLSDAQREQLALLWYRILERQEMGSVADDKTIERQAASRAGAFAKALQRSPGVAGLSRTPLFLLSLLKLHRLGRDLPHNRFEASKEIVEQLVDHQPRRRAKDAMKVDQAAQGLRQRDRLLEDFAFGLHTGEIQGSVADGAFEHDAIARATALIMTRTGSANRDQAEEQAGSIFAFGEEVAGLLVKKAPNTVGFLHRSLQEYLSGSYLSQLSMVDRLAFVKAHAGQPVWTEPILYLLFLTRNEQEVGQLLEAIDKADATDAAGRATREGLLTEATFADFAHDLRIVRGFSDKLFAETELHAWGARQHALVASVVDGLFSQSVSTQCAEKLAEWIPDYHGWGRHAAVLAMGKWDKTMRPACLPVLTRILAGDHQQVARAAAHMLAEFFRGDAGVKRTLLKLFHEPRSIETMHAAFLALARGWSKDADVRGLALRLRQAPVVGLQIDAIRARIANGEAGLDDLDVFAKVAYQKDRLSSDVYTPDLVEYFSANHKKELIAFIEKVLMGTGRPRIEISPFGALILADPAHSLVEPTLRKILAEDWSAHELFVRSHIPLERVAWTPELTRAIEERFQNDKHLDYEWYWISKSVRLESLKRRMMGSMKAGKGLTFWSANGLAEFWGKDDPEVAAAFQDLLGAPSSVVAEAAEAMTLVIDDLPLARSVILKALGDKPNDARFLLRALRRLGLSNDDEAFKIALSAGDPSQRSLYDNLWREEMIRTFGSRPEVQELARAELFIRNGEIGAVAEAFAANPEMCGRILKVLAPLPEAARLGSITVLGTAAASNKAAFGVLASARHDTDGATGGEAVMAWTDACIARDAMGQVEVQFLANELDALGPEYQHRRAAAVAALAIADKLPIFAAYKDRTGKLLDVDIGRLIALDKSDRYIKRILPHWDRAATLLGGDETALARFELTAETTLPILDPGTPNAKRIFDLLDGKPDARVALDAKLAALRRFAPESPAMRALIEPLLRYGGSPAQARFSNRELWPSYMAAEIFAEHFARSDLRHLVVNSFSADPSNECAAAALAETALRDRDDAIETLLAKKTAGREYGLVTVFRLTALLGNVVGALEWLLERDPERTTSLNCSYWVPAVLRGIERYDDVADALIKAADNAPSASARISELSLLGRGSVDKSKVRPILERALRAYEATEVPVIAYDVTTESYRLGVQAMRELLD